MEKGLKIPKDVRVEVKNGVVVVTGSKTFEIPFDIKALVVSVKDGELRVEVIGKATKPKVAKARTIAAHVRNSFTGMSTGFSKKLQIVYSHFPMSVEIKENKGLIKNFLGEKVPRVADIIKDTKVSVKGQEIELSGPDKYSVGQTANNFIEATKVRKKDRRVFQDGIYPVI